MTSATSFIFGLLIGAAAVFAADTFFLWCAV